MKKSKPRNFIACLTLPIEIRQELLSKFRPSYSHVYCRQVTLAYNVDRHFPIPVEPQEVKVWGLHRGARTEALFCDVQGRTRRPDGRVHFITLSVREGVRPGDAGLVEPTAVNFLDEILAFSAEAQLAPVAEIRPELRSHWLATT
jgi:hypothetical protein